MTDILTKNYERLLWEVSIDPETGQSRIDKTTCSRIHYHPNVKQKEYLNILFYKNVLGIDIKPKRKKV